MWELGLRCHRMRRGGAKVGGMSKSEVIISREELSSARKGDVSVGGHVTVGHVSVGHKSGDIMC